MKVNETTPTPVNAQDTRNPPRLLLALDVQSESDDALKRALAFATIFKGSDLDIAWVQPIPMLGGTAAVPFTPPDPMMILRQRLEKFFENNDPEPIRQAETTIQLLVATGDPADEISKIAFTRGSQMIVTGAHDKRGALTDLLLGSVAKKLVAEAPCPVLVVRPNLTQAVPKVEEPLQDQQARRRIGTPHSYTGVTRNQKSGENMPLLFPMNP